MLCQKIEGIAVEYFFFLIMQPFLYLEGALKLISEEQFKNTTTKIFQVRQQFRDCQKFLRIKYEIESTLNSISYEFEGSAWKIYSQFKNLTFFS